MMLLLLSAAQGPAECCLAVAKISLIVQREAAGRGLKVTVVDDQPGEIPNTLKSVVLSVEGEQASAFVEEWCGSIQWQCQSPFRPQHKRKNWFISARVINSSDSMKASLSPTNDVGNALNMTDIQFETCRSSGPGGQHVNKTNSAVRALHVPSGESVKVETQRSQHANKKLAVLLLQDKLRQMEGEHKRGQRQMQHRLSKQVERGGAIKVFKGERFLPA